jgi:hypothetical protein
VLWTFDLDDIELWVLNDTLSGQVTLDSPPSGTKLDYEDKVTISWKSLPGVDEDYQYKLYDDLVPTIKDTTDDLSVTVPQLEGSSEYKWKVRVLPGEPFQSRWSDSRTFHTALGEPPWAPDLYAPSNGDDEVLLRPSFAWETAYTGDSYEFMLAQDSLFAQIVAEGTTSVEAFELGKDLEYDTTYFWKVRAMKGKEAVSRWSEVGTFTTISPAGPPPPPPATVTEPAPPPPQPVILPTPIPPYILWIIVGIGAALIIAVIILIIRTRRAV